jgi:hypothetical protein
MDFNAYYADLESQLLTLVKKRFRKYREATMDDVTEYLRLSKGRLQDYARLLETGTITQDEQEFLSQALKENALLFSLKESGRSAIAMKRFAESVVSLSLELALVYVVKGI